MGSSFPRVHTSRETAEQIRIVRSLCILFMVTVHFWPGDFRIRAADMAPAVHGLFVVVLDYLGRSSVSLLSIISGWLLVTSFAKGQRGAAQIVLDKAGRLLVPMAVWSAIFLLPFVVQAALTGNHGRLPASGWEWINAFLAITAEPANFPLGFLRDVFVAAALGAGVLVVWRRSMPAGLVLLLAGLLACGMVGMVFLRFQIAVFFAGGMLLALAGAGRHSLRPGWGIVLLLIAAELVLRYALPPEAGTSVLHSYLMRVAMALFIWQAAISLREAGGRIRRALLFMEPHIFTVFCSHLVLVMLAAPIWTALGLNEKHPLYPLVFLAQWGMVTAGGVMISLLGRRYAPIPFSFAMGERKLSSFRSFWAPDMTVKTVASSTPPVDNPASDC